MKNILAIILLLLSVFIIFPNMHLPNFSSNSPQNSCQTEDGKACIEVTGQIKNFHAGDSYGKGCRGKGSIFIRFTNGESYSLEAPERFHEMENADYRIKISKELDKYYTRNRRVTLKITDKGLSAFSCSKQMLSFKLARKD